MLKARTVLLPILIAAAVAGAGCGEDDTSSSAASTNATTTAGAKVAFEGSPESELPVGYPEPEPADITIGFASPLDANELINTETRAMKLETEALGGTFVSIDAKGSPDEQVSAIEQLIARKVDGIIVFPLDASALTPVLKKAADAGIPVIGIDADLERPDAAGYTSQIWQGRDYMSYLQATAAAELMPEGATYGQIGFAVPVPTIERQIVRAREWASEYGLTSVGRVDNPTDDIAGGEKAMTQLLSKNPDIAGVIAYNEESATGAAAAARAAGKPDLVLIGNNGGSLGFASVGSGKIAATVQVPVPDIGRIAVWGIYDAVAGDTLPEVVVAPPSKLIDSANVEDSPSWDQTLTERYGKTK